jgi:hypothetical protein
MSKIRVGTIVVVVAILAATAFAQSPGMSAQQGQPTMPGQQAQPAAPGQQPTAPAQQPPEQQPPPAQAQPNTHQGGETSGAAASPADAVAKQLAQTLNLSDAQTTQVRNALEDERTKLLALQKDSTIAPQDKQAKLMDIRRNASDKVMSILTPDQQRKLAELVEKQHQQPGAQQPQQQRPPQ